MQRANMAPFTVQTKKLYGPLCIEDESSNPRLTQWQCMEIYERFEGAMAVIRHHHEWGIWAGSTCTRECRNAFFG